MRERRQEEFARLASDVRIDREHLAKLSSQILGFAGDDNEEHDDEESDIGSDAQRARAIAPAEASTSSGPSKLDVLKQKRQEALALRQAEREYESALKRLEETCNETKAAFQKHDASSSHLDRLREDTSKLIDHVQAKNLRVIRVLLDSRTLSVTLELLLAIEQGDITGTKGFEFTKRLAFCATEMLERLFDDCMSSAGKAPPKLTFIRDAIALEEAINANSIGQEGEIARLLERFGDSPSRTLETTKALRDRAHTEMALLDYTRDLSKTMASGSVRSLQHALKLGQRFDNGNAQNLKFLTRLTKLCVCVLHLRCASERRSIRHTFDWPGEWLDEGFEHKAALHQADIKLQNHLWSMCELPPEICENILQVSSDGFHLMRELYGDAVDEDEEFIAKVPSHFFNPKRNRVVRHSFFDSAAAIIQASYRGFKARRALESHRIQNLQERSAATVIQRNARAMVARKKAAEAKRIQAENDKRLMGKVFALPTYRLLTAILENIDVPEEDATVLEDGVANSTSMVLAVTLITRAPIEEAAAALHSVDPAKAAMILSVLRPELVLGIFQCLPAVAVADVLGEMSISVEAKLLMQMIDVRRREILQSMDAYSLMELVTSLCAEGASKYIALTKIILHSCFVGKGNVDSIAIEWARQVKDKNVSDADAREVTKKLISSLKGPFPVAAFIRGIRRILPDGGSILGPGLSDEWEMARCCDLIPRLEGEERRTVNALLHALQINDDARFVMATLKHIAEANQTREREGKGGGEGEVEGEGEGAGGGGQMGGGEVLKAIMERALREVGHESLGLCLSVMAREHGTECIRPILTCVFELGGGECGAILSFLDVVTTAQILAATSPNFAAMLLLDGDRALASSVLDELVDQHPDFATSLSANLHAGG